MNTCRLADAQGAHPYRRGDNQPPCVQATIAELTSVSPLETFFDQTLGEHGHQVRALVALPLPLPLALTLTLP